MSSAGCEGVETQPGAGCAADPSAGDTPVPTPLAWTSALCGSAGGFGLKTACLCPAAVLGEAGSLLLCLPFSARCPQRAQPAHLQS